MKIVVVCALCVVFLTSARSAYADFEAGAHLTIKYDANYPTPATLEQMHEEL